MKQETAYVYEEWECSADVCCCDLGEGNRLSGRWWGRGETVCFGEDGRGQKDMSVGGGGETGWREVDGEGRKPFALKWTGGDRRPFALEWAWSGGGRTLAIKWMGKGGNRSLCGCPAEARGRMLRRVGGAGVSLRSR